MCLEQKAYITLPRGTLPPQGEFIRKDLLNMVFVINNKKQPLDPCSEAKARILLDKGKARVFKRFPFTIIVNTDAISDYSQNISLKLDYGSKVSGVAILINNEISWVAHIKHNLSIKDSLLKRSAYRRSRRNRKTRYRQARFLNRRKPEKWIPPSLQSKVNNIKTWVDRLIKICPITKVCLEHCKFDTQLMSNPEINGIEYQQGTLQGYEVREYLLEKFGRKCCYCKKEGVPLEIEHIIPKSRGGSNSITNLALACRKCNQKKGKMTAKEFGHPEVQKQATTSMKDAASVNSTRWHIFNLLKDLNVDMETGSGAVTKMNRIANKLPKDHHWDASCVGRSTPNNLEIRTKSLLVIQSCGRGSHCRTNTDKYGFPKAYLPRKKIFDGFTSGNMCIGMAKSGKYKDKRIIGKISVSGNNCMFYKDGKYIASIKQECCKNIHLKDGYGYNYIKILNNITNLNKIH